MSYNYFQLLIMISNGKSKIDKILKINLLPILIFPTIIWLVISVCLFGHNPRFDLFSIIIFSIPACLTFVWGLVCLTALLFGYGLESIKDSKKPVMNNIGLIKPIYASIFHRVLLFIFIVFLFLSSFVSFGIAFFS